MGDLVIFGFPVIMIILIVWFKSNERIKRYQLQADLYAKALEKGQTVPADLFAEPEKKENKTSLKSGIICMVTGIGIALTAWILYILLNEIMSNMGEKVVLVFLKIFGSIGIIPFMIGIAFLIIHFADNKKNDIRESLRNAK